LKCSNTVTDEEREKRSKRQTKIYKSQILKEHAFHLLLLPIIFSDQSPHEKNPKHSTQGVGEPRSSSESTLSKTFFSPPYEKILIYFTVMRQQIGQCTTHIFY